MTAEPEITEAQTGPAPELPVQAVPARQAPPAPPRRSFRSQLAVLAAGALLVLGVLESFAAFASLSQEPPRPDLGPVYAMTQLLTQAALLIVGVANLAAAVGVYLHLGSARRLAFGLALIGLGIGLVFVIGPLNSFRVALLDPLMVATLLVIVGYAYVLIAMLVAGSHFRTRVEP